MAKEKGGSKVMKVHSLVAPILEEMGFSIWDVRFEKEGPDYFLKILIDPKEGTMDMDMCEKASRAINPIIDEADPIPESYYMEVGSPGLGRKLTKQEHYDILKGNEILVHLIRAQDGVRDVVGILKEKTADKIIVVAEEKEILIDVKNVSYTKLNDDANLF